MAKSSWRFKRHRLVVAFLAVAVLTGRAGAQELPSNLQIVGSITGSSAGVEPAEGDQVLVVAEGKVHGSGTVIDTSGNYFIEMSKTQAFNGTVLTMRIRKSSGAYQLEFGPDNQFSYNGGFPFPARTTINATIGSKISGSDSGGGDGDGRNGGGVIDDGFDVNGDGIFSQADIDLIKTVIVQGDNDPAADIDKNGIVNTRDAILAIRALVEHRHRRTEQVVPADNGQDEGDETAEASSG